MSRFRNSESEGWSVTERHRKGEVFFVMLTDVLYNENAIKKIS